MERLVSAGRKPTSPVHFPDGRDRFLDALAVHGATLDSAAESIGTSLKTVRRFAEQNPDWAAQLELARAGLPFVREGGARSLAPFSPGAIVDAVPCDAPELARRAESYNGITRAKYEEKMLEVFEDTEHPQWPHVFKVLATLFDGPTIIRARKKAEEEHGGGDGGRRVVFVFVSKSSAAP
jgi:hypothetical protein